jgi:RNA polymerase sigma-70 factor (ECF subfamily)
MPPILPFRRKGLAPSNFEEMLRPHVEFLYRLAWRFTGNAADAEDLVQDVLLKLFPRVRELSAIEQLRPWLARVLYRQYIDFTRLRDRSPTGRQSTEPESGEDPLERFAADDEGPEERAERRQLQDRIVGALRRLNPEQRAVITLHDVEGYSLVELETVLDAPLGTLKSRLHRARQQLRGLLAMEPFSAGERVKE